MERTNGVPKIHLKPELLEGLAGTLPEVRRRAERHLRTCAVCALSVASAAPAAWTAEGRSEVLAWRPRVSDYDAVLDRVLGSLRPQLAAAETERVAAPLLLDELMGQPPGRRQMLLRNSRRFQSCGLCSFVLEKSWRETPGDPRRGEELASLALELAEVGSPPRGAGKIEDLRARGWMLVANARRIWADWPGAEAAFLRAEADLRCGSRDRLDRADLLVLKASLRRAQRRFPEGVRMLRRALSIWLSVGEARRAAETLASWALLCMEGCRTEEAIHLSERAIAVAGPDPEPRLGVALQHNLAVCLIDSGRFFEAQAIVSRTRGLYGTLHDPASDLRLQWLQACIAVGLGPPARAADLLIAVREGFLQHGNTFEAAVVCLDLAQVRARMGRGAAARRIARVALAVFCSYRAPREALAAFLLIRQTS
jgi:tetratricopeptide (TPR) repeat protein